MSREEWLLRAELLSRRDELEDLIQDRYVGSLPSMDLTDQISSSGSVHRMRRLQRELDDINWVLDIG